MPSPEQRARSKYYDTLFKKQGGVCYICGNPPGKKKLAVDHNHVTGKIRGLLCNNCNRGLGLFKDNGKLLARALIYLFAEEGVERPEDLWSSGG